MIYSTACMHIWIYTPTIHTHTYTQTHTQRERQTDRQTERQTDRQTDKQTDTQTHRQTDRQTEDVDICTNSLHTVCARIDRWQKTTYQYIDTGWRRLIRSPKLQIIFHKRATKNRSLLREMTYKDKGSYESLPPCSSTSTRTNAYIAKRKIPIYG